MKGTDTGSGLPARINSSIPSIAVDARMDSTRVWSARLPSVTDDEAMVAVQGTWASSSSGSLMLSTKR